MHDAHWLAACDLPRRWRGRRAFTVLDAGFASGRRWAALRDAWRADPDRCERLHLVGLQQDAGLPEDAWLRAAWPEVPRDAHRIESDGGRILLTVLFGEPAELARGLRFEADAFVLDGVATLPADRLALLVRRLARAAAPGATLVAAASTPALCAALAQAGFVLSDGGANAGAPGRLLGARHAPHWVPRRRWPDDAGRLASPGSPQAPRHAAVVGAGLAGTAAALALARRGWTVDLFEAAGQPACGASGNPAGAFHPHISRDDSTLSRASRAGMRALRLEFDRLQAWDAGAAAACGVLQLARDEAGAALLAQAAPGLAAPGLVQPADRLQASERAGAALSRGGLWYPQGGWARPAAICALRLQAAGAAVRLRPATEVAGVEPAAGGRWALVDRAGCTLGEATVVVLATGGWCVDRLLPPGAASVPLAPLQGRLTCLPARRIGGPRCVLTGAGYLLPAVGDIVVAGVDNGGDAAAPAHGRNLARVAALLDAHEPMRAALLALDPSRLSGRAAMRCATPDRLPVAGAVVDAAAAESAPGTPARALPRLPGLFVLGGYGSRGLTWSSLLAEHLAAMIEREPSPLAAALADVVDVSRFARLGARAAARPRDAMRKRRL